MWYFGTGAALCLSLCRASFSGGKQQYVLLEYLKIEILFVVEKEIIEVEIMINFLF
jgi:hypothetical protein